MDQLGPGSMSEDECVVTALKTHFSISEPDWRSQHLSQFLHVYDGVRRHQKLERGTQTHGRDRFVDPTSLNSQNRSVPVKGLPANSYDKNWLQKLSAGEVRELNLQPEYDFTHHPEVLR